MKSAKADEIQTSLVENKSTQTRRRRISSQSDFIDEVDLSHPKGGFS